MMIMSMMGLQARFHCTHFLSTVPSWECKCHCHPRSEPSVCRRPVATADYGFVWPRGFRFYWRSRQEIRSSILRLATGECERWTDRRSGYPGTTMLCLRSPRARTGGLSRVSRKPSPSCPSPLPPPPSPLSAHSGGLDLETQSLRHVEDITTTRCPPLLVTQPKEKRGKHPVVIEVAPREGTRKRTNYSTHTTDLPRGLTRPTARPREATSWGRRRGQEAVASWKLARGGKS